MDFSYAKLGNKSLFGENACLYFTGRPIGRFGFYEKDTYAKHPKPQKTSLVVQRYEIKRFIHRKRGEVKKCRDRIPVWEIFHSFVR